MLARRPSLQNASEFISEFDDVIARPADGASEDELAAFRHALGVARDTGDYAPVLRDGASQAGATRFVLRHIDPMAVRRLFDDKEAGEVGASEWFALFFLCSVERVVGFDVEFKHITDKKYGKRLPDEALKAFPDYVINEVGVHALNRALAIPPKA